MNDDTQAAPEKPGECTVDGLVGILDRLPQIVAQDDVKKMISLQERAIERLETTNKSMVNCNIMAQNKLASTTKLYRKTAKQISETKRDLDLIYKKILDLRVKIKAERPELFPVEQNKNSSAEEDEVEEKTEHVIPEGPEESINQVDNDDD